MDFYTNRREWAARHPEKECKEHHKSKKANHSEGEANKANKIETNGGKTRIGKERQAKDRYKHI